MKLTTKLILLSFILLGTLQMQAQTKRELKDENAKLKQEVTRLNQDVIAAEARSQTLAESNKRYQEQNAAMNAQVVQLQQDNLALNKQYQDLLRDYEAMKASTGMNGNNPSAGNFPGGGIPVGPSGVPAPGNDNRKCAYYQGKLTANTSYTAFFNELQSDGYGLQVFSSKSLCQASEYAEKFKKDFSMYKTYLRCKQVGNSQMYAVVYGSLRDRAQASTYLSNLKKKYNRQFKGSFVVQH